MKLIDLCTAFPADPAAWPVQCPSKAIDFHLRGRVRTQFGGLIAASDLSRHKASSRLGVSTRPFEPGDALAALSRAHLVRTGEIHTRIDSSPGRQTAGFIFHGYSNMAYTSSPTSPVKGQLGWAAAALVQAVHESLSHNCQFVYLPQTDLVTPMSGLTRQAKRWKHCYVITDLLHNPSSAEASIADLIEGLLAAGFWQPSILAVRDVLEWVENNPLSTQKEQLLSPRVSQQGAVSLPVSMEMERSTRAVYFSGSEYLTNLVAQKEFAEKQIADTLQGTVHWLSPNTLIEKFLSGILDNLMRKTTL